MGETFDNARYGRVLGTLLSLISDEAQSQMQGMWNPDFCTAPAGRSALVVFDQIEAELAHWRAFIKQSEPA